MGWGKHEYSATRKRKNWKVAVELPSYYQYVGKAITFELRASPAKQGAKYRSRGRRIKGLGDSARE